MNVYRSMDENLIQGTHLFDMSVQTKINALWEIVVIMWCMKSVEVHIIMNRIV